MIWFLLGLAICLASGTAALVLGCRQRLACWIGSRGAVLGGAIVLLAAGCTLLSGETDPLELAWSLPLGSANMAIDPLSAVFAIAIAVVAIAAAIFGSEYLQIHGNDAHGATALRLSHPTARKNLGVSWFVYNLLVASMCLVVVARNAVLFLIAWELMSVASFFLVMHDDDKESVRRAGWIYLVAMHIGTAFIIAMFLLLGANAESLDFASLSASPEMSGVIFVLALIGFGTKAGFMPMHVWLPEAHPAAPSHVSALMSGVMIKTGIYGLLRVTTLIGEPSEWWGWTLLGVGVACGVLGVLSALAQHNLKRLLAYHSVENLGIIAIGLGVGLLGIALGNPAMAALGLTGGLLHVVNHALFKSLLFLGAGSVLHASGTGEIDRLGGLMKRMPVTGATFLIGAAAICGLPPLNGFVSELLIYLGALSAVGGNVAVFAAWPVMGILVVGGLALIGGLAAACFTKAVGIVFLGEPRSAEAAAAQEVGTAMQWPMVVLAGLCVLVGLAAPLCPIVLQPAVLTLVPTGLHADVATSASEAVALLANVVAGSYILLGLIVLAVHVRRRLLAGRRVERAGTWDCGYTACTPRMQYTASSFARPLLQLFRVFLQPHDELERPQGFFPHRAALKTHTRDVFRRYIFEPLFAAVAWAASNLRWLQQGRIQVYVLYIAVTILALLLWKLG